MSKNHFFLLFWHTATVALHSRIRFFSSSIDHPGPVILPVTDSSFLSSIEDRISSANIRCLLYEIRNKPSLSPAEGNAISWRFFENMIDFLGWFSIILNIFCISYVVYGMLWFEWKIVNRKPVPSTPFRAGSEQCRMDSKSVGFPAGAICKNKANLCRNENGATSYLKRDYGNISACGAQRNKANFKTTAEMIRLGGLFLAG